MATDTVAASETALEIGLLGPLRVSVAGQRIELPTGRLPAMLAVLAMSAGQPVSVDRLATAVWGEAVSVDARANIQTNVKRLRRLIGADLVVTRGRGYALDVDPDRVDALRFERLLEESRVATDRTTQRGRLVDALRLWRGRPFDGVRSDWLEHNQATRLEERYLAALERLADLADGSSAELVDLATELGDQARRYPLRESLWVRLLVVLQRAGRSAEALERFEAIRARLADELGTDPGPELRQVHGDLLAGRLPGSSATVAAAPDQVVPRQLPAATEALTGRDQELAALDRLLPDPGDSPQRVAVAAITGTAGIGKTTLAVNWAHRVADRFPDGQLYVNLRGFDPARSPVEPTEAVRGFLDALQVPPQQIPGDLDAQAGRYRSGLAGRRVLVVLDNAHDAEQVMPLLPGTPGCLVVVTSRNRLPGLLAAGASAVALDLLDHDAAGELLARRLGPDRMAAEPDAADLLVTRCAGLPLALAVVGARAAARPDFPLTSVAQELREARTHLDGFDGGDATTDVRAVFSWSYRGLDEPAARLFRLLGLHPGPDLDVDAAAGLAGQPVREVRPLLADLAYAHLVVESVPGRYAFHDLLRAYATELSHTEDAPDERHDATRRMLDHYLRTAHEADLLLYPHGEAVAPATGRSDVAADELRDEAWAMAWFTAERRVLLAAIEQAGRDGFDRHGCHLAGALSVFLHRRGHWHDRSATQQAALDAAGRLGDRTEQARAHRNLAATHADFGRFDDAHRHFRQALDLAAAAGDRLGQARTHYDRNLAYVLEGRDAEALAAAEEALRLFEATGDQVGRATALTDVGWSHGRLGDHETALPLLSRALTLHETLDNRAYQAHTLSCLAETHDQLGDPGQAVACYRSALDVFREIGDRYGEASALARLGDLHDQAGDPVAAAAATEAARAILDELDPPAADQVRAQLERLA